jgi:predicted RNase H-like nuclease (RuvC/YqgF family)
MVRDDKIKNKAIYVYAKSTQMADEWKSLAKKAGLSISKFIVEHVENSLKSTDNNVTSRLDLITENSKLNEQLTDLEKRLRRQDSLIDKLEEDLRQTRASIFLQDTDTGIKDYERKLVDLLREPGAHTDEEILRRLGIKPAEIEAIKAVSTQLENLQAYGAAKRTNKGWTWVK